MNAHALMRARRQASSLLLSHALQEFSCRSGQYQSNPTNVSALICFCTLWIDKMQVMKLVLGCAQLIMHVVNFLFCESVSFDAG